MHGPAPWTETEALLATFLHSFHLSLWGRHRKGPKPQPIDSPPERRRKVLRKQEVNRRLLAQADAEKRRRGR